MFLAVGVRVRFFSREHCIEHCIEIMQISLASCPVIVMNVKQLEEGYSIQSFKASAKS